jgi:hypothetical protein
MVETNELDLAFLLRFFFFFFFSGNSNLRLNGLYDLDDV